MKRFRAVIVVVFTAVMLTAGLGACGSSDEKKAYEPASYIKADTSFDYADTVFLNTEKYPFLNDQGLFIAEGYENGFPKLIKADSEAGLSAFDKSKPTFVITHGVQFNAGRYGQIYYPSSSAYEIGGFDWERVFEGGYGNPTVEMTEVFFRLGFNVLSFQYGRFAESAETIAGGISLNINFLSSQHNVLSSVYGVKAMDASGEWSGDDAICGGGKVYSVAQFYAAEYARFARAAGDYDVQKEVYFVGHSMGGFLTPFAAHIVTELCDAGQLNAAFVPDRVTLQDPFCGWMMEDKEADVAWSGAKLPEGRVRTVYAAVLENLAYNDIAVEMYVNRGEMVPFFAELGVTDRENILKLVAYNQIFPVFTDPHPFITGHNAVREWHMLSILDTAPKADFNGIEIDVLTAAASTARVKELRGYSFIQGFPIQFDLNASEEELSALLPDGSATIYPRDDAFFIEAVYDFSEYVPVYGSMVKA
ncbi:MAG: hypothetical protein LBC13_01155 [Clostridiales bacterium]|jgi:pimeloyl-ACP methyl ester carboxylesterase|nr:hypothetical protein [Clostridiales bacterium]